MSKKVTAEAVDTKVAAMRAVVGPFQEAVNAAMESADIGQILTFYDVEKYDKNAAKVLTKEAAEFVIRGFVGALCYNVFDGYRNNGQKMLNDALDKADAAAERDALLRTEQTGERLHNALNWAARMEVQQAYRKALQEWASGFYTAVTGERYAQKVARSDRGAPDSAEQAVAAKLRERRAQSS